MEKFLEAFSKKKSSKDGVQSSCKECEKLANKRHYELNKDKRLSDNKRYCEKNVDSVNASKKKWLEERLKEDPDYQNRSNRKSYDKNREVRLETYRQYYWDNLELAKIRGKEYRSNNRDKLNAKDARRRAKLLQAFPEWADKAAIDKIYAECKKLCEETGEIFHVDHIVPLINELVCGLHVEFNLRIIKASDNLSKNNKLDYKLLKELGYHVE